MAMIPVTACDPPRHLPWRASAPTGFRHALWVAAMIAILAVCVIVVGRTEARLGRELAIRRDAAELIYLPPTRVLRAVSLGYEHALADVLWFRTINYFGEHYR